METENLETLKKYISQLGSITAANISRLHLTMAGRRHSEDTHVLFKQNYSQTQVPIFKKAQVSIQHKWIQIDPTRCHIPSNCMSKVVATLTIWSELKWHYKLSPSIALTTFELLRANTEMFYYPLKLNSSTDLTWNIPCSDASKPLFSYRGVSRLSGRNERGERKMEKV